MWINSITGEIYGGDLRFGTADFPAPGEPPLGVTHAVLDENGAFVAWAEPPPPPWQPAPVWRQFITGLDVEGNPHADPYARINGLANSTVPTLNTALFRLAFAWKEQGDQAFWQSRVSAAIANIEAMLGTGDKIAEHSAEVALFEAWNADYGLGLTFPW